MAQMRENGDRSALGGTLLFILGLLIAIVGGTVILPSSAIVSVLVILVALNLCFIGVKLLSAKRKETPAKN